MSFQSSWTAWIAALFGEQQTFGIDGRHVCVSSEGLGTDWGWMVSSELRLQWETKERILMKSVKSIVGICFAASKRKASFSFLHYCSLQGWCQVVGFSKRCPWKKYHLEKWFIAYLIYVYAAKSLQLCPTLWDPIDGSPPSSPIPGILQARTLEWVAISSSNAWKWKNKVKSLSHIWLLATPWTAAHQAPPSMGFSRQEYWSGLPLRFTAL